MATPNLLNLIFIWFFFVILCLLSVIESTFGSNSSSQLLAIKLTTSLPNETELIEKTMNEIFQLHRINAKSTNATMIDKHASHMRFQCSIVQELAQKMYQAKPLNKAKLNQYRWENEIRSTNLSTASAMRLLQANDRLFTLEPHPTYNTSALEEGFYIVYDSNDIYEKNISLLKAVEFRIYRILSRLPLNNTERLTIEVYDLGNLSNPIIGQLQDSLTIRTNSISWLTFNLTNAFLRRLSEPTSDGLFGLYLKVISTDWPSAGPFTPNSVGLLTAHSDNQMYKPFLAAYYSTPLEKVAPSSKSRRHLRKKRNTLLARNGPCSLVDMSVELSVVKGLDYILSPKQLQLNYCTGSCPSSAMESPTNHAILIGLLRSNSALINTNGTDIKTGVLIPEPACTPTAFEPMKITFAEGEIAVTKTIDDLKVVHCGCQ